jgi:hypothetical protein
MKFKQLVYARYVLQSEEKLYNSLGTVIGVYHNSTTDAQVYHLSFVLHGRVHNGYCNAEHVKPSGEDESEEVFAPSPQLKQSKKTSTKSASVSKPLEAPIVAASPQQPPPPAVFPAGTRVFVEEYGGLGKIADFVLHNKRIDGYKVSYKDEPDFKEGEMEVSDHSCAEVFRYLGKDAWVKQAIAREKRVHGVHGFNTDSGKGTEYAGFGKVVGLCVDVRNRPRFYAVLMEFAVPEVFYFNVDDVKEVDVNTRDKEQKEQQQAQVYPSSAQAAPAAEVVASSGTCLRDGNIDNETIVGDGNQGVIGEQPDWDHLTQKVAGLKRLETMWTKASQLDGQDDVVVIDGDSNGQKKQDTCVDALTAGDREKRKVTHWVHGTRITCLRLIQRMNPFAAKDSGAMWQQIAEQIHGETANVFETKRGKTVSCQVHSNGTALMMWYTRQLEKLETAWSEKKDKQSGQTGQFKGTIESKARESGENAEELEAEWNVLLNLKALQKDASQAATLKKLTAGKAKDLKDKRIPDAVLEMACSSVQVETAAIAELERRLKKAQDTENTLTSACRLPVMTQQEQEEKALLQKLKEQKQQRKGDATGEDPATGEELSSDGRGRGKNNLKRSFDVMTEQMIGLAKFLKEEQSEQQPTTLQDLQSLLTGIDKDVAVGLKLEGDERAEMRAMFLREYAKGRLQAVRRAGGGQV